MMLACAVVAVLMVFEGHPGWAVFALIVGASSA